MDGRESTISLQDLAPCPANMVDVACNPEDVACTLLLLLTLDISPIDRDVGTNEPLFVPNATTFPLATMPDSNSSPAP